MGETVRDLSKVESLLSQLDAAMQSKEVVRRVAHAMSKTTGAFQPGQFFGEYKVNADTWRLLAKAAIAAAVGGTKP